MDKGKDLPRFEGMPVHKNPLYSSAGFLDGDFGRAVHDRVMELYGQFDTVGKTNYKDGEVEGHTFHYIAAVNEVVRPQGLRTATLADLWKIRMRGQPSDYHKILCEHDLGDTLCALALRGNGQPNADLAGKLMQELTRKYVQSFLRGRPSGTKTPDEAGLRQGLLEELEGARVVLVPKTPVLIPLPELELEVCEKMPCRYLTFKLGEYANAVHAPVLNEDSREFDWIQQTDEHGLPNGVIPIPPGSEFHTSGMKDGVSGVSITDTKAIHADVQDLDRRFDRCGVLLVKD